MTQTNSEKTAWTADELIALAKQYWQNGEIQKVEALCNNLLNQAHGQESEIFWVVGMIGYEIGQQGIAIEYLAKSVKIAVTIERYQLLAKVYLHFNQPQEAFDCLYKAVELQPDSIELFTAICAVCEQITDFDKWKELGALYADMNLYHQSYICLRSAKKILCTPELDGLLNKALSQRQFMNSLPIEIHLFVQRIEMWSNFSSLIEAMQDGGISYKIVLLPFFHDSMDIENINARNFLEKNGYSYIWHEEYNYDTFKPTVIFIQSPYDSTRPSRFSCLEIVARGISLAYIPYGLDVGAGNENIKWQYNLFCQNYARWVFVRSFRHKELYAKYCDAGNEHVYPTGHPKFDNYYSRFTKKSILSNGKKTILWTPHFSVNVGYWSTFDQYVYSIINLCKSIGVNLVVRPHPLFKDRVKQVGGDTAKNYSFLLEQAQNNFDIRLDFELDYERSFNESDALIADAGSFLLEYLPTTKPIIYLVNNSGLQLNESAAFVYDDYYIANSEKDIYSFIAMVSKEQDPLYMKRMNTLEKELIIPEKGAGYDILKIILSDRANDLKKLHKFSQKYWEHADNTFLASTDYYEILENVLIEKVVPSLRSGSLLLDIGCGNGRFTFLFAEICQYVIGVDISSSLISQATLIAQEKILQISNLNAMIFYQQIFLCNINYLMLCPVWELLPQ